VAVSWVAVDNSERPFVERNVVRAVVLDSADRVLLLQVGAGETHSQAVIRELREETGIVIAAEQIATPRWKRDVLYDYRGTRRLQHEAISLVRLAGPTPTIQSVLRDGFEQQDLFDARWWTHQEIVDSCEWFYPRSLPSMLSRFLDGAVIEEALEVWDKDAWRAASS
jgi:8-oxo-dGTP pyrophosphatase MutT (NUDIX family)